MRALWGFQGRKDGLDALQEAGGDATSINDIYDRDAYDVEVAVNLSLTYRVNMLSTLTVLSITSRSSVTTNAIPMRRDALRCASG
jgi:hypothetical protein